MHGRGQHQRRHRRGMIVPDDLSVVGFDDTALATSVWPELTTVKQPIAAMAEAALELIIADLRGRRGARSQTHRTRLFHALIIRKSSAPPRGSKRSPARRRRHGS